jgi:hypothetical protein
MGAPDDAKVLALADAFDGSDDQLADQPGGVGRHEGAGTAGEDDAVLLHPGLEAEAFEGAEHVVTGIADARAAAQVGTPAVSRPAKAPTAGNDAEGRRGQELGQTEKAAGGHGPAFGQPVLDRPPASAGRRPLRAGQQAGLLESEQVRPDRIGLDAGRLRQGP